MVEPFMNKSLVANLLSDSTTPSFCFCKIKQKGS